MVRDIDERMRADEAHATQARQLTAVLETLPSATVLVRDDGRILRQIAPGDQRGAAATRASPPAASATTT